MGYYQVLFKLKYIDEHIEKKEGDYQHENVLKSERNKREIHLII